MDLAYLSFTTSIEAYQEAFRARMAHTGRLTPYRQVQLFTGGLLEHIRINVQLHDP